LAVGGAQRLQGGQIVRAGLGQLAGQLRHSEGQTGRGMPGLRSRRRSAAERACVGGGQPEPQQGLRDAEQLRPGAEAVQSGTGEIRDGKVHIHAVFGTEGDVTVSGHLHWAKVETHFANVYILAT
jgi:hypothetical protein